LPTVYFISGCNGAGKTTASLTMLPEMLDCKEFVNADSIASGISPFQPEKVAFEAGRLMLQRIEQLAKIKIDFAIETTLSSKNHLTKIKALQKQGYEIVLIYFWLNSTELAIERIKERVRRGGHFVPEDIVKRRYYRGIKNLFNNFITLSDYWFIFDNSQSDPIIVAEGIKDVETKIFDQDIWNKIKRIYNEK